MKELGMILIGFSSAGIVLGLYACLMTYINEKLFGGDREKLNDLIWLGLVPLALIAGLILYFI